MDAFIIASSALSQQLLPILGLVALIILIIVLANLNTLIKNAIKTVEKTDNTFKLVDTSIEKMQAPLDTVTKLSKGIDEGYDAGIKASAELKDYLVKNKAVIAEKVSSVVEKTGETINTLKTKATAHKTETKVPGPEDIIGD